MTDPYLYPGTDVLRNKENIRDARELQAFERMATASRMETLLDDTPITAEGYCEIHRYIFPRRLRLGRRSSDSGYCEERRPLLSRSVYRPRACKAIRRNPSGERPTWSRRRTIRDACCRPSVRAECHSRLPRRQRTHAARLSIRAGSFRTGDSTPLRDVIVRAVERR